MNPFQRLFRSSQQKAFFGTSPRRNRKSPRGFVPRLEVLEGRTLPSTFTVRNLADSGPDSLRAAIAAAEANPGPDLIDFAPQLRGKIGLTSGELGINTDLTINGPGADKITINANHNFRIFVVDDGNDATTINVEIVGLTLSGGNGSLFPGSPRFGQSGGAIANREALTLSGCTLSDNEALGGAGVLNVATGVATLTA